MSDLALRASSLSQFFKGERAKRWFKTYGISALMGVFLALVGAMQTFEVSFGARLFYWVSSIICGTAIAHLCAKFLDRFSELKLWQEVLIMFVVVTLLVTVFVWAYTSLYFGFELKFSRIRYFLGPVSIISLAMTGLHFMADQIPMQTHKIESQKAKIKSEIKLIHRLDKRFSQARILAVSSEDHYLRIYCDIGEALVLMRLYDAINELNGIEGSQVHRSWWVAKEAISEIIRQDGRSSFRLNNGQIVPISRTFIKALRAENWL